MHEACARLLVAAPVHASCMMFTISTLTGAKHSQQRPGVATNWVQAPQRAMSIYCVLKNTESGGAL